MLANAMASLDADGVFTAEGDKWKKERRIVAPALNKKHVEDYLPSVKLVARRLIKKWETKTEVVASVDAHSCGLDVAALSILGADFDSLNDPDCAMGSALRKMFEVTFLRAMAPIHYWNIPFIGQKLDGGEKCMRTIHETTRSLVEKCRERNAMNQEGSQDGNTTFLEKVIALSEGENSKFSDYQVIANLIAVIAGGTDTSGNTLAFCLWELAHNKILQVGKPRS